MAARVEFCCLAIPASTTIAAFGACMEAPSAGYFKPEIYRKTHPETQLPGGDALSESTCYGPLTGKGPPANFSLTLNKPRNPVPTVDAIIEVPAGIILIKRRYEPAGWALPGGFVEYGETVEAAAVREAKEETGLTVTLTELFGVYSDPHRDPRHHTIGIVFLAAASGIPTAGDDAAEAEVFTAGALPAPIAFDHGQILADYFSYKRTGRRPVPRP